MGMFEKGSGSKHSEKGRVSTEFIEHTGSRSPITVEDGSAHGLQGSTEKDVPLTQEDIDWTNEFAESERARKLVRRLDWKLIPILVVIYLASFLDRGNIGNARIEGLEADLGLSPQQYSWALSVFFFAYATFEMFANIPLKILRPSVWLPLCICAWGTVMTLQGIVQNYGGLVTTRFLLGMTEAAFFPGAMFILSNWYTRRELQRRMAYLYASASIAGAFSGILAFGLAKMDGIGGLEGWRWIFIIEGIATVIIGFVAPFLLQDSIERSKWLDPEEKRFLRTRLSMDRQGRDKGPFKKLYLKQALTDYKIYMLAFIYFADAVATYSLSFALPSIIRQLGYTSANAQLLTIPVYVAAAIYTVLIAVQADKTRQRAKFVLIPYLTAIAGLIICLATPQPRLPGLILFAVFLIAMGAYSVVPSVISWNANNSAGEWKRGIAIGMQIGFCNYGGVVGSNIFLSREAPRYPTGYGTSLAFLGAACIVTVILHVLLKRENARRDLMSEEVVRAKYSAEELADMGDKSPLFRYET